MCNVFALINLSKVSLQHFCVKRVDVCVYGPRRLISIKWWYDNKYIFNNHTLCLMSHTLGMKYQGQNNNNNNNHGWKVGGDQWDSTWDVCRLPFSRPFYLFTVLSSHLSTPLYRPLSFAFLSIRDALYKSTHHRDHDHPFSCPLNPVGLGEGRSPVANEKLECLSSYTSTVWEKRVMKVECSKYAWYPASPKLEETRTTGPEIHVEVVHMFEDRILDSLSGSWVRFFLAVTQRPALFA